MRKTRLFIAALSIMMISGNIYAQSEIADLIKKFSSSDWKEVKAAKMELENYESAAIPAIFKLLHSEQIVKLENYGSLRYPGAEKFYGYGQIIDYDIDNLSIRAGWLLEDISFYNFGFSGNHIPKENLIPFIKITFSDYYNNSNNRKKLESLSEIEIRRVVFKLSKKKAVEWWKHEGAGWTRLQALVDALKSFDEKRQVNALFYMRNGETKCSGLSQDYYIDNISREIVRLSASDTQRVSEHARLILFDTKFLWLESKNTQ